MSVLQDENGLWYNTRWSERQWLASWSIMAKRYANNSAVVGAGLRNEPRPVLTGKMASLMTAGLTRFHTRIATVALPCSESLNLKAPKFGSSSQTSWKLNLKYYMTGRQ